MKKCLFFLPFLLCAVFSNAQTSPKREFRAAWIATFVNIDWPLSRSSTPQQERDEFIARLDMLKQTGVNAIFIQVRSQCDALYNSSIEPWTADLTGTQGVAPNPYYDPLEFIISECRKRGIEVHAWLNPYRALSNATTNALAALAPNHIINTQPSWIMSAGSLRVLNPGIPAVWDYVNSVVIDITKRYDLDGIHFDDYFYPDPTNTYNDDAEYNANPRGFPNTTTGRANWRRSNVDSLIKRVGDSVRSIKPWVKFGISPTGIWMSQANDANGSNTSAGARQHHRDLYANSRLWIQQGWIDYLIPQIYWFIGQTGSDYSILAPWWNNNAFGKHIYSGMAGYKVGDGAQNAAFATDRTQIPNQVRLNRSYTNILGSVIYGTTSLRLNPLNFRDSLRLNLWNKPALLPNMSWKNTLTPAAVTNLQANYSGSNFVTVSWNAATSSNEFQKPRQFAIYRSESSNVNTNDASNLIAVTNADGVNSYVDNALESNKTYYYTVTALNRFHDESIAATAVATNVGVLPLKLLQVTLSKKDNSNVLLQWITTEEIGVGKFEIEISTDGKSFTKTTELAAKNTAGTNAYEVTLLINNCNEVVYARLKIVDLDGTFSYSRVTSIQICKTENSLQIYPSLLANSGGNITISTNKIALSANAQLQLFDASGRLVFQRNVQLLNGRATIAVNELTSGNYFLQLLVEKSIFDGKLIIQ
ncbi:MAG: family 10 glycosylhydrolase [Chitinophagaceae bacterium]